MFIRTKPSALICGVTTRVIPVLIFSVAVLPPPATPPVPVLITVPVDGNFTRRIVRLWIVAGTLFIVITRGRLITLPLPSCSRAVSRDESDIEPSSEPRATSSAEPRPGPNPDPNDGGTGKSAISGTGRGATDPFAGFGARPSPTAPPPIPTVPGKFIPVGFPVAGPALKL